MRLPGTWLTLENTSCQRFLTEDLWRIEANVACIKLCFLFFLDKTVAAVTTAGFVLSTRIICCARIGPRLKEHKKREKIILKFYSVHIVVFRCSSSLVFGSQVVCRQASIRQSAYLMKSLRTVQTQSPRRATLSRAAAMKRMLAGTSVLCRVSSPSRGSVQKRRRSGTLAPWSSVSNNTICKKKQVSRFDVCQWHVVQETCFTVSINRAMNQTRKLWPWNSEIEKSPPLWGRDNEGGKASDWSRIQNPAFWLV